MLAAAKAFVGDAYLPICLDLLRLYGKVVRTLTLERSSPKSKIRAVITSLDSFNKELDLELLAVYQRQPAMRPTICISSSEWYCL